MGNAIEKTDIISGDTNVIFNIFSSDGGSAFFAFKFWRNYGSAYPRFQMVLGSDSNTKVTMQTLNESSGEVESQYNMANLVISSTPVNYAFDVCGETIMLTNADSEILLGQFSDPDIRDMTIYSGDGSSQTVVTAGEVTLSTMGSCVSASSTSHSSLIPPKKTFPWWAILLITIGGILVIVIAIVVAYFFLKKKPNKRV